ncbi:MAG: hypothetical protein LBD53_03995 [Tannerella sp.]|jgi:hypothetical protein|nr:hypothetical protein [Tannerella sp.]
MKKTVFIITCLLMSIQIISAIETAPKDSIPVRKRNHYTRKESSKEYHTNVMDWQWHDDQWWYKDKPQDTTPPNYSIIEEVREIDQRNGKDIKRSYRITIEVTSEYKTTIDGWEWNGTWYYYGKETDLEPADFEVIRREKKTTVDLDYDTQKELKIKN